MTSMPMTYDEYDDEECRKVMRSLVGRTITSVDLMKTNRKNARFNLDDGRQVWLGLDSMYRPACFRPGPTGKLVYVEPEVAP